MNNRNPFIPNVQGNWVDPHQLYSQNPNFSNNNQSNGQVPFSAHQQVQQLQQSHQSIYNIGYTTQSSSLPLQAAPGSIFWDDGPSSVSLNNGGMQVNYSYQNVNSGYQQQQQQQHLQQHQQVSNPPTSVVHQIVTQSPRMMPLTLDASQFVHFPMNLSPPTGILSLNSRTTSNNSPGVSIPAHSPSRADSLSLRSSPMSVSSPSPTPMQPLQLNSRSGSTLSSTQLSSLNLRSPVSSMSNYGNNSNMNLQTNSGTRLSQNSRSHSSMNHFPSNDSSSPNQTAVAGSRNNSRSPAAAFSGNSPTHSPQQLNSRSSISSTGGHNNSFKSQSPNNGNNTSGFSLNSPTYTPAFPSSLNTRFSPAAVQFLTNAAAMNLTEASLRQQFAINAAAVNLSNLNQASQNFMTSNNLRLQQQAAAQQHQDAPVAHSRSSIPVTPFPFHSRSPVSQQSPSSASPSPSPPPPPKRKRGPTKKRQPKKPLPINPTIPMNQNSFSFQSNQIPNRPSVISSVIPPPQTPLSVPLSTSTNWSINQPSMTLPTMNPFPLVPTPVNNLTRMPISQGSRLPININPSNLISSTAINSNRMRGSLSIGRPTSSPPNVSYQTGTHNKDPSPLKSNNNKYTSVLDYAMERAGIQSNSGRHEDDNSDVFHEEEILKLVGSIPDQSELRLGSLESKSKTDGGSINSWEQDAFSRSSHSGLDDLEYELRRFYCPPSPPKAIAADANTSASISTNATTLTTLTSTNSNNSVVQAQPNISASGTSTLKLVGAPTCTSSGDNSSSEPQIPLTEKLAKESVQLSSDDDDCEVILVKLNPKRKKTQGKRFPPKKMPGAGGKGDKNIPGQINPSSGKMVPVSNHIINRSTAGVKLQQRGKKTIVGNVDNRTKSLTRSAYPNGRCISVAPKTTVPIPPISSNIEITVEKVPPPSTYPVRSSLKRKKTGGAILTPTIVHVRGATDIHVSTPIFQRTKPTARKSTAPIPKSILMGKAKVTSPSKSPDLSNVTNTAQQKSKKSGYQILSVSDFETEAPTPSKRSRKETASTNADSISSEQEKEARVVIKRLSPEDLTNSKKKLRERPPIKLKLSLRNLTPSVSPTPTDGKDKHSKGKIFKGKSKPTSRTRRKRPKGRQNKRSITPPEDILLDFLDSASQIKSEPGTSKRQLRPKPDSSENLKPAAEESEDELLIVEEYLADSDDSFDPEGERDEASSESETEPEPETENFASEVLKEGDIIPDKLKTVDSLTVHEESTFENCDNSPLHHDFTDDVEDFEENEPGPGPFKNEPKELSNDFSEIGAKLETSTEADEKYKADITSMNCSKTDDKVSSESEDEDEVIEAITAPKTFEMPKPQVIIKGTKEDADKALTNMRQALAQLSKFKIPFFGK